jgi:hypothetical protein
MKVSAQAAAPFGAGMEDKRACPPHQLRIHDRRFLRNGDTALLLHVRDETSNEHGANYL